MNEKIKNVVDYAKTHKKEILIGTAAGVGGAIIGIIGYREINKIRFMHRLSKDIAAHKLEEFEHLGIGSVTQAYDTALCTYITVRDVPLSECGRFGECLKERFSNVESTEISIAMDKW